MSMIVRPTVRRLTRRPGTAARLPLARVLLAGAMLTAALACRNATGPRVARSYTLRRIDGRDLPRVLYASPVDTTILLGETLALRPDGTALVTTTVYESAVVTAGQPAGTRVVASTMDYRVTGTRLELSFPCPPNANCILGPLFGTIRRDDLVIGDESRPNAKYYVAGDVFADEAVAGSP